jgi:hypothetical protein
MLFASMYTYRGNISEESQQRLTDLFVSWQLPKGFAFKAHYALADGTGGIALIEAESEAALYEGAVPWTPFIEFRTVPVVEIEKAVSIALGVMAWRKTVK